MVKQLVDHDEAKTSLHWSKYSELQTAEDRKDCLNSCHNLTDLIYDGLDVQFEINSVNTQNLGDTVLLWQKGTINDRDLERRLIGLAVCHCGAGTEAGSGACYVKFGAVLPGDNASVYFDNLLCACETFAKEQHMSRLVAGVNTARPLINLYSMGRVRWDKNRIRQPRPQLNGQIQRGEAIGFALK